MNSMTSNAIKWANAEYRKNYNKSYYSRHKLSRVKTPSVKVECDLCGRKVTEKRLSDHQETILCISNRE